jgi:hypothetical protein
MHLLISGIPASGKSTFCRWLEEKKGFLHLDVEKPGVLDRYGLATAWSALFDTSRAATHFIEALDKFKRPVAIDWGFAPECLNTVRKLFDSGVMLWWFAADWAVARRKFIERGGKGPVEGFDIQIRKFEAALPEINALFGSHKEYALPSTGIYPSPDKLWKSMLDTLVEPSRRRLGAPIPRPTPDLNQDPKR